MHTILLAIVLLFTPAKEEKILVLKNANLVDIKNQEVHYRKNIYLKGEKIWKITPVKRSDIHELSYLSIDMTGKYVLAAHTDVTREMKNSAWASILQSEVESCMRSEGCELIEAGQQASMIVLLKNPFENLSNEIEGVVADGQWHSATFNN